MIGEIIEALPNCQFIVRMENGNDVRCYLSGKMYHNQIRVMVGDKVEYQLGPDLKLGRIIKRLQ